MAILEAWKAQQTLVLQDENLRLRNQVQSLEKQNSDLMELLRHREPRNQNPPNGREHMKDVVARLAQQSREEAMNVANRATGG